jgi:peptide-methionine (S)-S-oxide reductase
MLSGRLRALSARTWGPLLGSIASAVVVLALIGMFWRVSGQAADTGIALPSPALEAAQPAAGPQSIVLAGGCFWGVQLVFQHVKGVSRAISGYAGGSKETAMYETVSSGTTGHAESVEVTFDPAQISLGRILQVYFSVAHDPTQLNRQGPDTGTQYRSAIFYADESQKRIAEAYIAQLDRAKVFRRAIVTKVERLTAFYPAEAYHQDFLLKNPNYPYIVTNDLPKIANLKTVFPARYLDQPVTAQSSR